MTEVQKKQIYDKPCAEHLLMFRDAVRVCLDILRTHNIEIRSDELDDICEKFKDNCYIKSNTWFERDN